MKRLVTLFLLTLIIVILCSCGGATNPETISLEVRYKADIGGSIEGQMVQAKEIAIGEEITLEKVEAKANDGYKFVGWDDGYKEAVRQDTVNKSCTFVAKFEKIKYNTISYKTSRGGRVVGITNQKCQEGAETEQVEAVPSSGYKFVGWSDGVTTAKRKDTVSKDLSVTAQFEKIVVNISYEAGIGGQIEGELNQSIEWGGTTSVAVAVANDGYEFVGWNDGVSTSARTDIAKNNAKYIAQFKRVYTISFGCDFKFGTIDGKPSQKLYEGEKTTQVTAKPHTGYEFLCWSNGETTPTITVEAKENVYIEAYFCYASAGLPVISIYTENNKDITSKDYYLSCSVTVNDTEGKEHLYEVQGQIRARGNSTFNYDKKPYKIKFDTKQELFGFGKAKDWVLLANYIDKSLIRNYLVFKTAKEFSSLGSTPDCQIVDVYVNDSYRGVYILCEQVEVNEHRVEVSEDISVADTGYLVEMDAWKDGIWVQVPDQLSSSRAYSIKFPNDDEITEEHKAYIKEYLSSCISVARGNDYEKVKELIDVKSFAQAYIICEVFKCPDVDYSSFFLHKDAGGKLYCGPVWDFDMAFGNVNHKDKNSQRYDYLWSRYKNPWFNALLNHKEFSKLVVEELHGSIKTMEDALNECYEYVYSKSDAMKRNFEIWDVIGVNTWTNPDYIVELKSWEENVEFTKDYFKKSLEFMLGIYTKEE